MADFVEVASENDLEEGAGKVVEVSGTKVALFRKDGKFYAINNTCIHEGGPLGEGSLEGYTVVCPWHGWQYDLKTGKNKVMPDQGVDSYEVKVEDGKVKVKV